jgi:hypothetical protein
MDDVLVAKTTFEFDTRSLEIDLVQDVTLVRKLSDKANILRLASIGSNISSELWQQNQEANMRMRLVCRCCMYGYATPIRMGQHHRTRRLHATTGRGERQCFLSGVTGNKRRRIRRRVRDLESHPGDVQMLHRDDGVTDTHFTR